MAYSGATKILKPGGESLDKFEESVSQVSIRESDINRHCLLGLIEFCALTLTSY